MEIMIVVAIISILASMAMPTLLRSRRRAQATQVLDDLRTIDNAVISYALETNKGAGAAVSWTDVRSYIKSGTRLEGSTGIDPIGNAYVMPTVDALPKVPLQTFNALSTVAPVSFWSPYNQ